MKFIKSGAFRMNFAARIIAGQGLGAVALRTRNGLSPTITPSFLAAAPLLTRRGKQPC
jgi:hypothetical protein